MSRMMRYTSGWFRLMALATSLSKVVFPVLGCDTIMPRCPFPMGANRSMSRVLTVPRAVLNLKRSCGNSGVKNLKGTRFLIHSGLRPLTLLTSNSG